MSIMGSQVYLDHAATTPLYPEALDAMLACWEHGPGNPAAIHQHGQWARAAVEDARASVAGDLGVEPDCVVFTSGGTESDNWAIKGIARAAAPDLREIIVSSIEHSAVLESAEALARTGFSIIRVGVDSAGRVDPDEVARCITRKTVLVSVMHANNEVGTIQPVAEIGEVCRTRGVPFHCDAVQTGGAHGAREAAEFADLVSLSGHKMGAAQGVGVLYVRRGIKVERFHDGGSQERGRRAGTLNVAGIVAMGAAARYWAVERGAESVRQTILRDRLVGSVTSQLPGVVVCGGRGAGRLPGNAHFVIPGVDGESLLVALDSAGVSASAGAACHAGSPQPSHVLTAMGFDRDRARGAVRFTLGRFTSEDDIDRAIEALVTSVGEMAPLIR